MKKLVLMIAAVAAMTFVACDEKKATEPTNCPNDTVEVDSAATPVAPVDSAAVDEVADSAAAVVEEAAEAATEAVEEAAAPAEETAE